MIREQYMTALAKANEMRFAAVRLKRRLAAMPRWDSARLLADELDRGVPDSPGTRVELLLLSVPSLGPEKVANLLNRCGVKGRLRVDRLTERQRDEIVNRLRDLADAWETAPDRRKVAA